MFRISAAHPPVDKGSTNPSPGMARKSVFFGKALFQSHSESQPLINNLNQSRLGSN